MWGVSGWQIWVNLAQNISFYTSTAHSRHIHYIFWQPGYSIINHQKDICEMYQQQMANPPPGAPENPSAEKMTHLACGSSYSPSGSKGPQPDSDGPEPDSDGPPPRMQCNKVIYYILANDNPEEYPLLVGDKPTSTFSSKDGACTFTEDGMSVTVNDCDCSDPKKYNFYDKGRFKI